MSIQTVDEIIMKRISEIRPYFRNPRKHDKTVAALVEIIPKVGFNVPILIDEDGVIVKGHARYNAAIRLKMEQVPCVVTHADEETIKLDRLADNKISEFSEWIEDGVLHELDMLNTDFDLSILDFPVPKMEDIFAGMNFSAPTEDDDDEEDEIQENRRAAFQKYLEEHPSDPPAEMITTQASIDRAVQKQQTIPEKPKRYFKMVCEQCGHIMFVAEGEALFEEK